MSSQNRIHIELGRPLDEYRLLSQRNLPYLYPMLWVPPFTPFNQNYLARISRGSPASLNREGIPEASGHSHMRTQPYGHRSSQCEPRHPLLVICQGSVSYFNQWTAVSHPESVVVPHTGRSRPGR